MISQPKDARSITYNRGELTNSELISIYKNLVTPRVIEERMLIGLRQGKISKWFSAWGQEAISVGSTLALKTEDYICTMHRNLGVFTARNIPLQRLFAQWQGKAEGFTNGRDRSFHFGTHDYNIVGMISHLGSQMGVADGIALANKLANNQEVCLVFTGDGGTSEGDFHEAVNLAAVWNLPVIIIVENNAWGLSTPSEEQFKCKSFADKGIGYGIESKSINGNNILEVLATIKEAAAEIRKEPKPILIECRTFRMRGHEEASGTKYYPNGLQDDWEQFDPIANFEKYLVEADVLTEAEINQIREDIDEHVQSEWESANFLPKIQPSLNTEVNSVYKPYKQEIAVAKRQASEEMRLIDAIHNALELALQQHPNLVYMGQDIAEYGGVFKATEGFVEHFGKDRIRNTPICEAAVIGAALGLSIQGFKSMVEMQFSDFVTEGFNQIVNNLAKSYYRWQQNADVVVRMPTGAGVAAGPFHSQSTESWFTHVPGLKVVYPAFPNDAKGLLLAAFEDPNPVLFFEQKYLYRTVKEQVLTDYITLPIGKANLLQQGEDVSIVTYGLGVHYALELLKKHPEINADVIDLRTLIPLDEETIFASIQKTGKVILLSEDVKTGSFMAEVSSRIAEYCFTDLDAPIVRVNSLDTAVPFNADLEKQFLPKERFEKALLQLVAY